MKLWRSRRTQVRLLPRIRTISRKALQIRHRLIMNKKLNYFLLVGLLLQGVAVFAQDTTKRKTINITSSFKPVLRDAVKINFHASPAPTDSSKPRLAYNIPGQYLMLAYQPPLLKPVALLSDSTPIMRSDNYIKVGIGNVHQPYVKAGFSFGDGKNTLFNVFGDGYNSIGNRPFQKNSLASVGISGIVKTANNLEWSGKLGFKSDGYYLYGYQPDSLKFTKSDLLQRFETFEGGGALRNLVPTEFGLRYNPNIHFSVFSDSHSPKALEDNTLLILPLEKTIGENISFSLAFTASLTHYHPSSQGSIQNNLYYVSPAISYKTNNIRIKAELTPSWDNSIFHLLPNVLADITTNDQQFTLQFGLTGYYDKGSYQRFASLNPWLAEPVTLLNTRVQQGFAGFRGPQQGNVFNVFFIVNFHGGGCLSFGEKGR